MNFKKCVNLLELRENLVKHRSGGESGCNVYSSSSRFGTQVVKLCVHRCEQLFSEMKIIIDTHTQKFHSNVLTVSMSHTRTNLLKLITATKSLPEFILFKQCFCFVLCCMFKFKCLHLLSISFKFIY